MVDIQIWDSKEDHENYVGIPICFSDCSDDESEWLTNFCIKHRKPISIEIVPEDEADGNG